jgi:dihydrofolate reductase
MGSSALTVSLIGMGLVDEARVMVSPVVLGDGKSLFRTAAERVSLTARSSRLGLALVVIASAQLMVVLDATIVNVALPHVQRAPGFRGAAWSG